MYQDELFKTRRNAQTFIWPRTIFSSSEAHRLLTHRQYWVQNPTHLRLIHSQQSHAPPKKHRISQNILITVFLEIIKIDTKVKSN